MYDVLLKGGRVVDPSQGINRVKDVAVRDGKVVALADRIRGEALQTIHVAGKLVFPGLIDLHTHVYWKGTSVSVNADSLAARTGVTTFVDAGSSGAGNFLGFRDYVIARSRVRILAFLNIGFAGIFGFVVDRRAPTNTVIIGELCDTRLGNAGEAVRIGKEYPEVVVGIKVRPGNDGGCGAGGVEPISAAKKAAKELGKPLMVHIGGAPPAVDAVLPMLEAGDIITHVFRGNPNSLLDEGGKILSALVEARKRGVIFDLGHGSSSFSFETAQKMLDQGFLPDVISSDVHVLSINGPAHDLPTTMSKMLCLGMDMDAVIMACTKNPARAISRGDELGTLREGTVGDISILELRTGKFRFVDGFGNRIDGKRKFIPFLTISGGEVLASGQGRRENSSDRIKAP